MNARKLYAGLIGIACSLFCVASMADVVNSKHNMNTVTGPGGDVGVCVFCHTPHGANVTFDGAPLWNKNTDDTGFQRYSELNTSTLDGAEAPVGSVSLACLSCHDGTQAMDAVINAPGTGLNSGNIGNGATMPGAGPVPNLTKDLRDDHPISIQYAGGGCSDTDIACSTLDDPDFNTPVTAEINTVNHWWLDTTGGTTNRDKTDIVLYTRDTSALNGGNPAAVGFSGVDEPFVECASCHDPHNETTGSATSVQFLRISNANSAICVACHIK